MQRIAALVIGIAVCSSGQAALAADPEFRLRIVNHRFEPAELTIPANIRVKLLIENEDAEPEEFDSYALNREKVIPGKSKATLFIGPLRPGRYPFIGEFHAETAKGALIVAP